MEKSKIEQFLSKEDGYGDCFDDIDIYGSGYGCRSYNDDGSDDGSGDGSGDDSGYGIDDGSGYGIAFGIIASFCGQKVYNIDTIKTIIQSVHGNYAKGFILNSDFTFKKTYIAKGFGWFAHGSTLREANKALQDKIMADMDIEEKQEEFKRKFNKDAAYSGEEFFEWHHLLTGSCLQGRETFVKENGLDLKAKYTVKDFLKIVEGAYGWNSIKDLKEFYD